MAVLVHFAERVNGLTTYIGGINPNNKSIWQLSVSDVILAIESEEWEFVTQAPQTKLAFLRVKQEANTKFLISTPDDVVINNLDYLPPLLSPTGGVWPQSPMNYVGYLGNNKIVPAKVKNVIKNTTPRTRVDITPSKTLNNNTWDVYLTNFGHLHQTLHIETIIPFPAFYTVFISSNAASTYLQQFTSLELTPDKIQELNANNTAYFWWEPTNGAIPNRMAQITFNCYFPQLYWDQSTFTIQITFLTVNPIDRFILQRGSTAFANLIFRNVGPLQPPHVPQPIPQIIVPNLVGVKLSEAINTIDRHRLRYHTISNDPANHPLTYPPEEFVVIDQTPPAGNSVDVNSYITLTSRFDGTAERGIETLTVTNDCNEGVALNLWTYNINTGIYHPEGKN